MQTIYLPIFPEILKVDPNATMRLAPGGWPLIRVQVVHNAPIGLLMGSKFMSEGQGILNYSEEEISAHGYHFKWSKGASGLPSIKIGITENWKQRIKQASNYYQGKPIDHNSYVHKIRRWMKNGKKCIINCCPQLWG